MAPLDQSPRRVTSLPRWFYNLGMGVLRPLVRALARHGVSANTVTALSLVTAATAGVMLAFGRFGCASVLFVLASSGDAVDGLLARATSTDSKRGALFDASVDRYEEFFAFGGLAIHFRSSGLLLTLTLAALAGSFMVSWGSAQAEARHVAVPPGLMRRAERAACLGLGLLLSAPVALASAALGGPSWAREAPVILAIALIGVVGNVCAVKRIRSVAAAVSPAASTTPASFARLSSS
jgi:phosphatidylglycerophosphate synthase